MRKLAVAFALAGLSVVLASAQVPAGGEFQVNTYTTGDQWTPSAASDRAGDFVIVWNGPGDDELGGVFARRFDAAGMPRGSVFQVNTYSTGEQRSPHVASNDVGDFVVVWHSAAQDGAGYGIFAQRFDAAGVPRASEFRVNTYTTGDQQSPSVASDAAGNFVVAWRSRDGSSSGIFAQRYDVSGAPRGGEFRVNTYTTGPQTYQVIASDAAGNFVVAWYADQDGDGYGVVAQRFDAAGIPRGAEFQVNTYTTSWQWLPSVACDPAGNFVVAWLGRDQDGDRDGVFAQRFDASGARRGAEFQVNTYTTGSQASWLRLAAPFDAAGDFVVAWLSYNQDGSYGGVFAQRFDASGARRAAEFQVNTYTTFWQWDSSAASDAVGNLVVTWTSTGQDGHRTASLPNASAGCNRRLCPSTPPHWSSPTATGSSSPASLSGSLPHGRTSTARRSASTAGC